MERLKKRYDFRHTNYESYTNLRIKIVWFGQIVVFVN